MHCVTLFYTLLCKLIEWSMDMKMKMTDERGNDVELFIESGLIHISCTDWGCRASTTLTLTEDQAVVIATNLVDKAIEVNKGKAFANGGLIDGKEPHKVYVNEGITPKHNNSTILDLLNRVNKSTNQQQKVDRMSKIEWLVNLKGGPGKSYEISVIRAFNKHGFKSYGWDDEDKKIVSSVGGPCDYKVDEFVWNRLLGVANDYCTHLNGLDTDSDIIELTKRAEDAEKREEAQDKHFAKLFEPRLKLLRENFKFSIEKTFNENGLENEK